MTMSDPHWHWKMTKKNVSETTNYTFKPYQQQTTPNKMRICEKSVISVCTVLKSCRKNIKSYFDHVRAERDSPLKPGNESAPPLASPINVSALSKEPLAVVTIYTLPLLSLTFSPPCNTPKTVLCKVCQTECDWKSERTCKIVQTLTLFCCLNIYINKLFPGLNLCDKTCSNETETSGLDSSKAEVWTLKQEVRWTQWSTELPDFKVGGPYFQ